MQGHDVEETHPAAMFDDRFWTKWFDAPSPTVTSVVKAARKMAPNHDQEFDPITLRWAAHGESMSAQDLVEALEWLDGFRPRVTSWWNTDHDLLLCPVFVTPPPESGHFWSYAEGIQDSIDILRFTRQLKHDWATRHLDPLDLDGQQPASRRSIDSRLRTGGSVAKPGRPD